MESRWRPVRGTGPGGSELDGQGFGQSLRGCRSFGEPAVEAFLERYRFQHVFRVRRALAKAASPAPSGVGVGACGAGRGARKSRWGEIRGNGPSGRWLARSRPIRRRGLMPLTLPRRSRGQIDKNCRAFAQDLCNCKSLGKDFWM